jgi:hypothetical protein
MTAVQTDDSTAAVAREQLCGYVASPATREHGMMEETLFFFCAVRVGAI